MMSTLKVLVGKDLSLQDHKKAQFQRLAFALQSLLKARSFLAFALQSQPKASSCLAFAL